MVKVLLLTLSFFLTTYVNGQTIDTINGNMITFIEEAPLFDGDLKEFIQEKLAYPLSARMDTLEGTVIISFWIDTLGLTTNHKVIRGIRDDLDNEALRISKLIKFDRPALQRGKPIKVAFTIPIVFDLVPLKMKSECRRRK